MLVDGLCNREEMLVAAVNWAIDDIQLVGGSAGDGLAFRRTALIHDGAVVTRAALLVMVETSVPFRVFKTQNFEPTPIKLVVTAADTENRIVQELNAEVAAHEYAAAIGLMPADQAQQAVADNEISEMLQENLYEVLNIVSALYNVEGAPHLRLYAVHHVGGEATPELLALGGVLGRRLDLTVTIAGYGTGRLGLVGVA